MKFHKFTVFFLCFLLVNTVLPISGLIFVSSVSAESPKNFKSFNGLNMKKLEPNYVTDEIIVKFKQGSTHEQITNLKGEQGAEELMVSRFSGARTWKVPPSKTIEEWVNIFENNPLVEYAEPNYVYSAFWVPNDPYYSHQWNFDDDNTANPGGASSNPYGGTNGGGIRLEEAWEISKGTSEVVVAVLDTGVAYEDYSIPAEEIDTVLSGVTNYQKASDLAGTSFWVNDDETAGNSVDDDGNGFVDDVNGWDFVNNDAHPNDNNGHGTHVTGTIAQSTNNGLGVAGVSPNIVVMPIKVLDYKGDGTDIVVAEAIYYAANNGADIISLSLGGGDYSSTLEAAVAYAYNMGVVVIAASGNDGAASVDYPAAYDSYVIAVGATRYDETLSYYSNYGSSLDLVAPGGDVTVNQNGDIYDDGILQQTFSSYYVETSPPYTEYKADPTEWDYWFYQGTSMATPHVSGVAALLLSQDPTLTPDQVRNILQGTAEDLGAAGRDDVYGYGLIDAKAAVFTTLVPEFSCDQTVRIMPLGNSITKGTDSDVAEAENYVGYRQKLYLDLINGGYNVDFVGTQSNGAFVSPVFDADHEGHGGFHADQIASNVYGWLVLNPADVVLLHIGTNDILNDGEDVDEVEEILEQIDLFEVDYNNPIVVIVARIILQDSLDSETVAFNDAVESMVLARIDAGDDLVLVDMENALVYPDDLGVDVHPNAGGYEKMAAVWFDALTDLLPVCPNLDEMIHYWKLGEASGTTFVDNIGDADGMASGENLPTPSVGIVGGGQDFDGTTNRINSTGVSNPTSEFTVMAWVNADSVSGSDKGIVFKEGAFLLELESGASGAIDFTVIHSGGTDELCAYSDFTPTNQWVHYAGTFNGTHMAVYKNGTLLESIAVSGTVDSSTNPYVIGYSYFPGYEERFFDGKIDEVAIFDYSLSAQEIHQLFSQSAEGNAYYTYGVNLGSIEDPDTTSNLGTITFDTTTYSLPDSVNVESTTYSIEYTPATGYEFDHWTQTGSVTVGDVNAATTSITIAGSGSLTAVYIETAANTDPIVNYVHAWTYPRNVQLDPAGDINSGEILRIYTKVSDTQTSSDLLTVTIKYKAQSDSEWTTAPSINYNAQWKYWYYDVVIPQDATLGLYDTTIEVSDGDGGVSTTTETGEFNVTL